MKIVETNFASFFVSLLTLLFATNFVASPLFAQQTLPKCDLPLGEYVRVSDFNTAFYCAANKLDADPTNGEAQLVLARAAQELGRPDIAAEYAKSARLQLLTRSETYASYLISGMAEAQRGNRLLAQYYLRRGANISLNASELALIGRAMGFVRGQTPWSFSISANIDPSSNVNDGSMHDTFDTILGPFFLNDEAKAQSGIGYNLDLNATHRYLYSERVLKETAVTSTNTVYSGLGRNDYVLGLKSTLTYIQAADIPVRWVGSVAHDFRYVGDDLGGPAFDDFSLYYTQSVFSLERRWQPKNDRVWSVFGSYTLRNYEGAANDISEIYRLGGAYSFSPRQNVEIAVSGYLEQTDSTKFALINVAQGVTIGFNWALEELPYSLSGKLSYVHTEYEFASDLSFIPRTEDLVMLDLGVTPRRIQWYGFRPTFGVELVRKFSDNNRYDTFEASVYTKIQSVF